MRQREVLHVPKGRVIRYITDFGISVNVRIACLPALATAANLWQVAIKDEQLNIVREQTA